MTTWSDVAPLISFDYGTWGDGHIDTTAITNITLQNAVKTALSTMYADSPQVAALFNAAVTDSTPIRLAQTTDPEGAFATTTGNHYIGIAFSPTDYYMNDHGVMIQSQWQLELAHELDHLLGSGLDPTDAYGNLEQDHDFKGDPVVVQNSVATGEGLTDAVQASYFGSTVTTTTAAGVQLQYGPSYSDGQHVDAAIFDAPAGSDTINESAQTTGGSNVILGLDGDDNITGSPGADWIYGGTGNDSLTGGNGNDQIYGEAGNDKLLGGGGDDTLSGDNHSGITIAEGPGSDTILGGNGNDHLTSGPGTGAYLDGGDGNDQIVVTAANSTIFGGAGDDLIVVHKGTESVTGEAGNDVIDVRTQGGSGDDVITIEFNHGDGHDALITPQVNTVVDTGTTFEVDPNQATVDIVLPDDTPSGVTFISELTHEPSTIGDDDFQYATGGFALQLSSGDTLYLGGFHQYTSDFDSDANPIWGYSADVNFQFQFGSDPTSYSLEDLIGSGEEDGSGLSGYSAGGDMSSYDGALSNWPDAGAPPATPPTTPQSLTGSAGDDFLYGGTADDTISAGTGNDFMFGGAGDDTYIWHRGDGIATIYDVGATTDTADTLQLTDVDSTDVTYSVSNGDIVLHIGPSTTGGTDGGTVILEGAVYGGSGSGVDQVQFQDTMLTGADIFHTATTQLTTGDDYYLGDATDETIRPGPGNDYVDGGEGDDTVDYAHGDGSDTITDTGFSSDDRIIFDDVTPGQVTVSVDQFGDVALHIAPSTLGGSDGGEIDVTMAFGPSSPYGIDQIVFSDSTTWTYSDVLQKALDGQESTGDDTINGYFFNETIAGGQGDDLIFGGSADDNIGWAPGDGHDTITEYADSGMDILHLQSVSPSDVSVALGASGDDVILTLSPTVGLGGSIDLVDEANHSPGDLTGVESVTFDSGLAWSGDDLVGIASGAEQSNGTSGDDSLTASSSATVMVGADGNDQLAGGGGGDTLDGGSGNDTLSDTSGADNLTGSNGNDSISSGSGAATIDGGAGNDTLAGGAGADTFNFVGTFGHDEIKDFQPGTDHIVLQGTTFFAFYQIEGESIQSGANLVITDGFGNTLQLDNTTYANLSSSDFVFQ
jgi:Ca2+-binding RTX toxin-like protein